ncbi:MAG: carbohydrate kinase family protein [Candidatus Colwellbacteria bacterium]|nr:carbohydrate kinase family protein [Candidatus Colwellbacteria bacterium]
MRDVVTIGSATIDTFMEVSLPFVDYPDVPSGKAIAVPFGEKLSAKSASTTTGGNALNAAVTFRRQGLNVAPCVRIGCDVFGNAVCSRLREERIDRSFIFTDNRLGTSYSAILIEKGDRSIINYKGAGEDLSFIIPLLDKMRARFWYVSLPGKSMNLITPLTSFALRKNIRIAFNPSAWHIEQNREQLLKAAKNIDFLVLNEGEAASLAGIPFFEEKKVFEKLDRIVSGIIAVTAGSRGVTVSDGNYIYKSGIFKEKKLTDRTGAGDAFGSGFVAGLIRSGEKCERGKIDPRNIEYAIRLATANAASVVEKVGASEGVLTKKQFDNEKRWSRLKIIKTKIS